jgi:hypothetical protein
MGNTPLKVAITTIGLVGAAVHVWKPNLTIDSITIVLVVIAILPWLQPLIKSIELLGVKLELQELKAQVAEAKGAAESANLQAGFAVAAASTAPSAAGAAKLDPGSQASQVTRLAEEYVRIRKEQPSGDARTAAMTDVVRRMMDVSKSSEAFDVRSALRDADRGRRLFGYAYCFARPDASQLEPLVESVTRLEDKPFGQYWGLQALGRVLPLASRDSKRSVRPPLTMFAQRIQSGTDRDYEIKKLLRLIDSDS